MIREFGKGAESAAAPERPLSPEKDSLSLQADRKDNLSLGSFHAAKDDDADNDNTLTIASAILAGLLIIGGGIYAYEFMRGTQAPQQVALKTPATNPVTADQSAATDSAAPAMTASPQPAPAAPAPSRSRAMKAASNPDANSVASAASAATAPAPAPDAAINAPMTLTPNTAPPAEQSAPTGQTAMRQPVTAPDVSDQSGPSTPSMANNAAPGVNPPSVEPQAPAAQLPADQALEPAAQ